MFCSFPDLQWQKKKIELGKKLQRPLYFSECSRGTVIKKRQTKWCCVGSLVRQKTRTAILVGLELHQTPYLGLRHRDTVSSEPSQCSLDHLPCQPEDSFLVKSLKWGWSVASCCYTESLNTSVSACLPACRQAFPLNGHFQPLDDFLQLLTDGICFIQWGMGSETPKIWLLNTDGLNPSELPTCWFCFRGPDSTCLLCLAAVHHKPRLLLFPLS